MTLPNRDSLLSALELVRRAMPPTPQYAWPLLAARAGCEVWVKHENHTPVGAFKIRGGLVYFDRLARAGRLPREVISATRGNHGQSIAHAAKRFGMTATIVVPRGNSREKNAAMAAYGAELIETDSMEAARDQALAMQAAGAVAVGVLAGALPGWALHEGAIEKTFRFGNFHETMAFVNALAWIAHAEDHHPDLALSYGRCTVRFNTHSVQGISINDFICAAKADALVAFVG